MEPFDHILGSNSTAANPENVKAIKDAPDLFDGTLLQSVLEPTTYYRRSVTTFAEISAVQYPSTSWTSNFYWKHHMQEDFDKLKTELNSTLVLAFLDFKQQLTVESDAPSVAAGAVFPQLASCSLNSSVLSYSE